METQNKQEIKHPHHPHHLHLQHIKWNHTIKTS